MKSKKVKSSRIKRSLSEAMSGGRMADPETTLLVSREVAHIFGGFRLNPVGETVVMGEAGPNMSQLWTLGDAIAQSRGLIIFKPTRAQVRDNADMVLLRVPASGAYLSECLTGGKK